MEGELVVGVSVSATQSDNAGIKSPPAMKDPTAGTVDEDSRYSIASTAAAVEACARALRLADEKVVEGMKEVERRKEELEKEVEAFELQTKKEIAEQRKLAESVEAKLKELGEREEDFESLGSYIEERTIRVREVEEELEGKRKELEVKENEIEVKREELEECLNRFWIREKGFETQLKEFQVRLVELNGREKEIDEKEKQCREIESNSRMNSVREKEFEQRLDELNKKEAEFDSRLAELSNKEEGFRARFTEFEAKRDDSLREWKAKEREIEEDLRKLEVEKRGIEEEKQHCKELRLEVEQWSGDLEAREKRLVEQMVDLKEEKVKFDSLSKELMVKEKDINEKNEASRKLELEVQQRLFDLKSREVGFERRYNDVRAKEKEFDRKEKEQKGLELKLKESQARDAKLERCSRDLRAKEKEMEAKDKRVKELESELQHFKNRLSQFQAAGGGSKASSLKSRDDKLDDQLKMLGERIKDVELKEKRLEERRREVDLEAKKLAERMNDLEVKEKQFEQMCLESELKEKRPAESLASEVKVEPPSSSMLDQVSDANIRFCVMMNGSDLQMFLNERYKDHDSMKDEVETALKLSSDPAKIVLDAMQGFYPPHLKKGDVVFDEAVIRKSCIMLLEQLTKMSPEIKPTIRKEAVKLAFDWMTRMKSDAEHALEVLAFLQLLAAYGLASSFDDDELVTQLDVIAHCSQAPMLLQDLGLADKISSVIQQLIEKKRQTEAARLISAFELYDEFPTMSSLEDNHPASNIAPLLQNKSAANIPSDPVLTSSLDTSSITLDSRTSPAQCHGAKRSWKDACAGSNHDCPDHDPTPSPVSSANIPAREPGKSNTPVQQPDRPSSDQGCSSPLTINSEQSVEESQNVSTTSKSVFVPPCVKNGCDRLNSLCGKIQNNRLFCREVSDALVRTSDPAEFVLGVLKNPSSLTLMMGNKAVTLAFPGHGPLLLLDRLWRMSPCVDPDLEREALSFAMDWKSKFSNQFKDHMEPVCFMLFLAAYKLESTFNQEDIFSIFWRAHWSFNATMIFQTLRLNHLITKFIEYLVRMKQPRQALCCISISDLLDNSPSAKSDDSPSAKSQLDSFLNKYPDKPLAKETLFEQIGSINKELEVWAAIVKDIEEKDENLANCFRVRITFLKKLKAEKLRQKQKQRANGRHNAAPRTSSGQPRTSSHQQRKRDATTSSASPQPQEESANKRRRVRLPSTESRSSPGSDPKFHSLQQHQQPLMVTGGSFGGPVVAPSPPVPCGFVG